MENNTENTTNQQSGDVILPKYGIIQSLSHMMGVIKSNPKSFIGTVVISHVISILATSLVLYGMTSLLLGEFGLLFASFSKIIIVLVVGLVVYTLLYAFVYAFNLSSIAYALSSEKNSTRIALKKAITIMPRIVKVNAWVAVITFWPIVVAAFLPLLLISSSSNIANSPIAVISPILILVALIWALIAMLRYSLAPYVALLEPEVPVKQTLKRSEQLLKKGGQWFVFKGVLFIFAVTLVLGITTGSNLKQLENTDNITINIIFILFSIMAEGAMVMLYLNRSRMQDPATAPKSTKLLLLVFVVIVALIGFASATSKKDIHRGDFSQADFTSDFTEEDKEEFMKIGNDVKRKTYMKTLGQALETYYTKNGFFLGKMMLPIQSGLQQT